MAHLDYVYLDNGEDTLRLGHSLYAQIRKQCIEGEIGDQYSKFFTECGSSADADKVFSLAEQWPPS